MFQYDARRVQRWAVCMEIKGSKATRASVGELKCGEILGSPGGDLSLVELNLFGTMF